VDVATTCRVVNNNNNRHHYISDGQSCISLRLLSRLTEEIFNLRCSSYLTSFKMDAIHHAVDKTKVLLTGEGHVTHADVVKAAKHEEELHYKKVKEDLKGDKKIADAAEKVEKEAHKQRMKNLEANKDLGKAAEKLQHEQNKKFEKDMKADAKIIRAADDVARLQSKEALHNCHQQVTVTQMTTTGVPHVEPVAFTTHIH